LIHYTR